MATAGNVDSRNASSSVRTGFGIYRCRGGEGQGRPFNLLTQSVRMYPLLSMVYETYLFYKTFSVAMLSTLLEPMPNRPIADLESIQGV